MKNRIISKIISILITGTFVFTVSGFVFADETEPSEVPEGDEVYGLDIDTVYNEDADIEEFEACEASNYASGAHRADDPDPGEGNVFARVYGTFDNTDVQTILNKINEYRWEACVNGYPDPRNTSRSLTEADYVPIKWSYYLEEMAMIRAVESTYTINHTTLTTRNWSSHYYGVSTSAENLAWGYGSIIGGIGGWYSEKNDWINQNSSAVTGHYTSMINPSNTYVSIAGFCNTQCAEFSRSTINLNQNKIDVSAYDSQIIPVSTSYITGSSVCFTNGSNSAFVGDRLSVQVNLTISCGKRQYGYPTSTLNPDVYRSDNESVISFDSGTAVVNSAGTCNITLESNGIGYSSQFLSFEHGWNKIDGNWFFVKDDMSYVTGWYQTGGKWYYFDASGIMMTGWQLISGKWYYLKSGGQMVTGWQKIGSKWYYFASGGEMITGWKKIGSTWYYFESSGAMKTGWLKSGGKWYYFESSGAMLANTSRTIGGKTYRFNSNGVCTNP